MKEQGTLRNRLQHRFNPLHLFCRLRRVGVRPDLARRLCGAYERCLYRPLCSWRRPLTQPADQVINRAG